MFYIITGITLELLFAVFWKLIYRERLCYGCSCKPDAETYDALINAHGRAGQWRWAMNLMDDMLRAAVCNFA